MTSSASQIRAWTGPQILGYGFRPFFLGAAVFAAFAMIAWIGALSGLWTIPSAFGPVEWHVHEFLWGYLSAVTAGFMLTAVPNWTGRLPIVGVPLAALWATWALGRIAVFFSAGWPPAVIAILDLSFLALLILVLSREIAAGRFWRNLKVLALVAMLFLGNAIYHAEMMAGVMAHDSDGLRIGLASAVLMIAVIGGRIIPSFTRNWLARRGPGAVPEPFGIDDKIVIAVTAVALLLWVVTPHYVTTALALLAAGVGNLWRLSRWVGWRTIAEPLVAILHLAYLFLPLGFLAMAAATLFPEVVPHSAGLHTWTVGAIVLMTLAVMTRASLGHSGMPLTADWRITGIYVLAAVAALSRVGAGLFPPADRLLELAATCWVLAFLLFAVVYAPLFVTRRAS
ncbi:NnrS family protein [Aestuariivirga sp.]|uniref:NnrS family protein n=1 Tax=Aestuariivirga sp. TaxID=2650926 RepID=UPI0035ADB016